jgi:hypothetical protein
MKQSNNQNLGKKNLGKKETTEKSEKGNFNLQFKTLKTTSVSFYCSHRFL